MKNNIVQIGLWQSSEYNFLSETWWPMYIGEPWFPDIDDKILDQSIVFDYYGIDISIDSIDLMRKMYLPNKERNFWLCAGIKDKTGITLGSDYHADTFIYEHYVSCFTLSELFKYLKLDSVDILVMDIESDEHKVFATYDWSMKPKFMDIEIHTWPGTGEHDVLIDTVLSKGYKLWGKIDKRELDIGIIYYTKFLRSDIANYGKQ